MHTHEVTALHQRVEVDLAGPEDLGILWSDV
jgi:hypothetical protein